METIIHPVYFVYRVNEVKQQLQRLLDHQVVLVQKVLLVHVAHLVYRDYVSYKK